MNLGHPGGGASRKRSLNNRARRYYLNYCSLTKVLLCMTALALVVVGGGWFMLNHSSDPLAFLYVKGRLDKTYRIFGPVQNHDDVEIPIVNSKDRKISFQFYTKAEQRDFMKQFGQFCQKGFTKVEENVLLKRFEELPDPLATELWKYCVLYTGVGNFYWQPDNLSPLVTWEDLFVEIPSHANIGIKMDTQGAIVDANDMKMINHSMLRLAHSKSKVCLGMMRYIANTLVIDASELSKTLALLISHHEKNNMSHWTFFSARCQDSPAELSNNRVDIKAKQRRMTLGEQCSMHAGGYCCQVWKGKEIGDDMPVMIVKNTHVSELGTDENPLPFLFQNNPGAITEESLGMHPHNLPFIATIREYPTNAPKASQFETPNFFDILMENNCLPEGKDCYKCLKTGYNEGDVGGDCKVCRDVCPCYCSALCKIRPPPKRLAAEWVVKLPRYRRDHSRLIPRVIHQTWFEPVTPDKYPNMSRLIESFRQAGWQYEFYDDDRAAEFLSAHFPPQVRKAYDAIIPGAFKADLFRYCILLIMGGVYADMDIILESNLDEVLDPTIGYLTAQDSPGMTIGHRHCLWNGLMAATPGHPFLAQTVQNVVNNIQNRFTSVDYDDMLCPDPVLSVAHTVDTLFVCGPCILGASMNDILKRHRQTGFDFGDIDLYETERSKGGQIEVDPDDPRLLIPGRSVLLRQDKEDMGAHRFTWTERNLVVASTDLPDYDDRPKSLVHYSKTHEKFGVYGLQKLYTDGTRANEEVVIRVEP